MASSVLMFTRVGGEDLHVGKCSHAQARILSKKGHGRIEDGKLFLNLRPVHLSVAANLMREDDPNVSQAEVQRRLDWLSRIVGAVVRAETNTGAEATQEHIRRVRGTVSSTYERRGRSTSQEDPLDREVFPEGVLPEGFGFYQDREVDLPEYSKEDWDSLWNPDFFGNPPSGRALEVLGVPHDTRPPTVSSREEARRQALEDNQSMRERGDLDDFEEVFTFPS